MIDFFLEIFLTTLNLMVVVFLALSVIDFKKEKRLLKKKS